MPRKRTRSAVGPVGQELLDLIPRIRLFAGEDEATFEGLRQAFLMDLAPTTPYETALAENLVTLEWEIHRHRSMRDGLLRAGYRRFAQELFDKDKASYISLMGTASGDAKDFADALLDPQSETREEAQNWLGEKNIDLAEILAGAYKNQAKSIEMHERALAELETRRRRLREDLDRLKASRARPVEDAKMLSGE